MFKSLLTAALAAATLVPSVASAQSNELRRDRQDIRQEQRDVARARQNGDRADVQHQRQDVRNARQEYREDWRDYRNGHRDLYRGTRFRASFGYTRFGVGSAIGTRYYAPGYQVSNVSRWRLPAAYRGTAYVRHYNDLLLVNTRSGRVIRVYNGFYL